MNALKNAGALFAALLVVAAAASFGAMFSPGAWYAELEKPFFNPPNWIFGPVWTLLYLGMAVAAWLVWLRRKTHDTRPALALFVAQLLLNALWSWLFFGLNWLGVALVEILLLEALILATAWRFWRVSPLAGMLFVPYAAWVAFASLLNFSLWWLNG